MTTHGEFRLDAYCRDRFPAALLVVLSSEGDFSSYEEAINVHRRTGDRPALYAALLALGVPADAIRRVAAGEIPVLMTGDKD